MPVLPLRTGIVFICPIKYEYVPSGVRLLLLLGCCCCTAVPLDTYCSCIEVSSIQQQIAYVRDKNPASFLASARRPSVASSQDVPGLTIYNLQPAAARVQKTQPHYTRIRIRTKSLSVQNTKGRRLLLTSYLRTEKCKKCKCKMHDDQHSLVPYHTYVSNCLY